LDRYNLLLVYTGIFPTNLKIAQITPIYKAGDTTDLSNYRPISALPLISKIFERCMYNRITKFASKYSLILNCQFGFQKGKSTCDALIEFTECIYNGLNASNHNISVLIDLRKAYETVRHDILLDKLSCYGVRGVQLDWFRSYLFNRTQCVRIGNSRSDLATVNVSIAQGSVLGCFLFLIYVNDLPKASPTLTSILFADDTTLCLSGSSYAELIGRLNVELERVKLWLVRNRLSLNIDKTVAILFTNRRHDIDSDCNVVMDGRDIVIGSECKYLGVLIDDKLSFDKHIGYVCSKISKSIGMLYKLSPNVPDGVLLSLYNTLIYPYLVYCNVVRGGTCDCYLNRLLLLQKKIVRIITRSNYLDCTDPLFLRSSLKKDR